MMDKILRSIKELLKRFHIKKVKTKDAITQCIPKTEAEFLFEFSLAEHCNLNCVGCAHFSPLAEQEFANYKKTT